MSLLQNSNAISSGGYNIANSLRFQSASSQYLTRTPASAGNRQKWTWSGWVKRGTLSSDVTLFGAGTSGSNYAFIGFYGSGLNLLVQEYQGATNINVQTSSVYRDPSAWYHVVVAVDTTQATAANRVLIYINNSAAPIAGGSAYPTQNFNSLIDNNNAHQIGERADGYGYFDGYMTEVNFIDGQALTPSSFGETDTLTGQWVAKKYTGTYGTNGFYLPFIDGSGTGSNSFTYSEDFSNAAWTKLSSTVSSNTTTAPNGASNGTTLLEDTALNSHGLYRTITESNVTRTLSVYAKISNVARPYISLNMSDFVAYEVNAVFNLSTGQLATVTGANANYTSISTSIVSVGNGWYRCSLTATKGSVNPNNNLRIQLCDGSGNVYYTGGGTSFGTFIWGAQAELSSAVGPYYSTVASAQASTLLLGKDYSVSTGGYNNWTLNNFTRSAGVSDCWMYDVPSGNGSSVGGTQPNSNYCVLNPLDKNSAGVISGANLNWAEGGSAGFYNIRGTIFPTEGKYYWEITCPTISAGTSGVQLGLATPLATLNGNGNTDAYCYLYSRNGGVYSAGTGLGNNTGYNSGDIIGIAFNRDANSVSFYLNGVAQTIGISSLPANLSPFINLYSPEVSGSASANFGQRAFAYTPPSGFKALCTANLPTSTIVKGNQYMDATTYTGNGAARSITNAGGFSPDLVWMKRRNSVSNHYLQDTVRGALQSLFSDSTSAEATQANTLTSFNSNGFSLGTDAGINNNGDSYVAWQWDAGSSTVTNTNGTISSQVRANTTAGVSVVTYTGTGVGGATIGHGLGVTPKMIIVKNRISTVDDWTVYHVSLGNTTRIRLNLTAAANANILFWNNTSPTSSAFTVGGDGGANGNGQSHVAYCFAEISGFSKAFSYTGNGSADGVFVYLGFRPKFVLIKSSSVAGSTWRVWDTSRSDYNVSDDVLSPNESSAELSNNSSLQIDILSNGFKCRNAYVDINQNAATYIGIAFAENPFQNSNAR